MSNISYKRKRWRFRIGSASASDGVPYRVGRAADLVAPGGLVSPQDVVRAWYKSRMRVLKLCELPNQLSSSGLHTILRECYHGSAMYLPANLLPAETRVCRKCGRRHPLSSFRRRTSGANARMSECNQCHAEAERVRRNRKRCEPPHRAMDTCLFSLIVSVTTSRFSRGTATGFRSGQSDSSVERLRS